MKVSHLQQTAFFASRPSRVIALLVILGLGLAIRLYDLTDLPLDFHPTRQLLSALKARGMYYQNLPNVQEEKRDFAIQQWKRRAAIEPEVIERIVAFTYRFTGEQLWIARLYSSLFWAVSALFVFLLGRELVSIDGALVATAIHLFLPYGIMASRSFQPDPLMVMFMVVYWWAVLKWSRNPASYVFAIMAGVFGGLAIFVKFVAAFFVIGGGLGAVLGRESVQTVLRRPQFHVMTILGMLPGAAYAIYGIWVAGYLGQQFGGRFLPALFLSPAYYLGWLGVLNLVAGGAVLSLALMGLLFLDGENLRFMLGLWVAYALFGLYFNYHISSHDYYSLPLIPIVALSAAAVGAHVFTSLASRPQFRLAVMMILSLGIFSSLWSMRAQMKSIDYRPEAQMWTEISQLVGDMNIAGLTQDYGQRLIYFGWKNSTPWPTMGDRAYHNDLRGARGEFEKQFEEIALKKELFVVTDFDELNLQPWLQKELETYPVFAQGAGYVIYDLRAADSQ